MSIRDLGIGALALSLFFALSLLSPATFVFAADVTDCAVVNDSSNILNNVSSVGSCFTIAADNVDFNCGGFNILYDTGGEGSSSFAINASNRNNVTIRNCTIIDGSIIGGENPGIWLSGVSNITVFNSTVSSGAFSGPGGDAIFLENAQQVTLENLTLHVASQSVLGANVAALALVNSVNIIARGLNLSSFGIFTSALRLVNSPGNTFQNIILHNATTWINATGNSTNNMTNVSFVTRNGSIRYPGTVEFAAAEITRGRVNVNSSSSASVNSSALSFLNTSARVTLFGITFAAPRMTVDFNDDGNFQDCGVVCTFVSFINSILTFDVSHFTSFSTTEGNVNVTLTKTDSPDPVNVSNTLSYVITINVTEGNASNVTLTDTYPSQVIFLSGSPTPLTGTNTTFIIGNLTTGQAVQVNISVFTLNVSNGTIINNTANISYANSTGSILAASVSESTTVSNDSISNLTTPAPPPPPPSQGGGGGGGGGGGVRRGTSEPVVDLGCFESWSCGDWTTCEAGTQTRECVDLRACGTKDLLPKLEQSCEPEIVSAPEPAETPEAREEPPARVLAPQEDEIDMGMDTLFYVLVAIALVGLGWYGYNQYKQGQKHKHHKK